MEEGLLSLKWNSHKVKFFEHLKIIKDKSYYTDATLAVEGKLYPVHKLVMSNCSEYFRDIFESTQCKSPVIVLKDVRSRDIEALLDYMYFGEVNVNQYDLASLLKTAECLQIEGLNSHNVESPKLCKTSTISHENTQEDRPPPKRRRFDSSTISPHTSSSGISPQTSTSTLVNTAQSLLPSSAPLSNPYTVMSQQASAPFPQKIANPLVIADQTHIPLHTTLNTEKAVPSGINIQVSVSEDSHPKQDETPIVKIELDDAEGQDKRIRTNNSNEGTAGTDPDPLGDCVFFKLEDEVDNPPHQTASSSVQPIHIDLTEHHLSLDHGHPEATEIPEEDNCDIIIEGDNVFKYKKLEEGTSKGRICIIEDFEGQQRSLVKKVRTNWDNYPEYQCKYAGNKIIKCTGRYLPKSSNQPSASNDFKVRTKSKRREHTCCPNPLEALNRVIKRECKKKAVANPELTSISIAEEVLRDNNKDINFEVTTAKIPNSKQLANRASYARRKNTNL